MQYISERNHVRNVKESSLLERNKIYFSSPEKNSERLKILKEAREKIKATAAH